MMKILVVGGYGLVGTEVYNYLKLRKNDVIRSHYKRTPYTGKKKCHINLLNESTFGMALADVKPDVVYLCAAYTNVDKCEFEPYAFDVNLTGTLKFVEECQRRDIRVVFYSSSYVFDGTKESAYTEEDCPHPINRYGSFKLEVEAYVLDRPDGLVIRTVGVFGDDDKNFRSRMLALSDDFQAYIPNNQYMNPIHAKDLAMWSVELEQGGISGIVNVAGTVGLSKYEWAKAIRLHNGLCVHNIIPDYNPNQIADRPRMGELTTFKLRKYIPSAFKIYPELVVKAS